MVCTCRSVRWWELGWLLGRLPPPNFSRALGQLGGWVSSGLVLIKEDSIDPKAASMDNQTPKQAHGQAFLNRPDRP